MINQIRIKNFRAFEELDVPRLGRVNLIVGRNNIGKTALIEAIQIYLRGADIAGIAEYLFEKDEISYFENDFSKYEAYTFAVNFTSLFNGDHIYHGKSLGAQIIEPDNPEEAFSAYIDLATFERHTPAVVVPDPSKIDDVEFIEEESEVEEPVLFVEKGRKRDLISLTNIFDSRMAFRRRLSRRHASLSENVEIMSIPSGSISQSEIARYWDNISLRKNEGRVLELIRKVAPVEGISFVQKNPNRPERSVIVKLENKDQPIPLKSMGEGIARIIQIALTLESEATRRPIATMEPLFRGTAPRSYLFIDELENGIHYSILDSIWDFIFRVAESRDMQVFATTHSWDCIESFQRVAEEHRSSLGMLVNIQNTKNGKKAVCYDESELSFISKNAIEVR